MDTAITDVTMSASYPLLLFAVGLYNLYGFPIESATNEDYLSFLLDASVTTRSIPGARYRTESCHNLYYNLLLKNTNSSNTHVIN